MAITRIRRARDQAQQAEQATPFSMMNRPTMSFDDSNRENYIMRSSRGLPTLFDRAKDVAPLQIFPDRKSNVIVDYNLGRGGRDPSMIGGFGLGPMPSVTEVPTDDDRMEDVLQKLFDEPLNKMERPILPKDFVPEYESPILPKDFVPEFSPAGLLGPGPGLGDPTGEGGIIQKLGEFLGLTDPIDPENEGLPMDEFQGELPPGSMTETLEADADTYTLPNLLQMLNDARDAGNVDEMELLTNDLEMMYPGATMDVAELSDSQLDFMNSQMGTPDFYSNYQDYKDAVDAREEKPLFGIFGGQEPATDSEIINKLKETYGTLPFQVPAIV